MENKMFNADKPSLEELPSSAQLLKSTILAFAAAVVILVVVILPAEYGLDPTGAGRALGLTEMGEIKQELAEEAAEDHSSVQAPQESHILAFLSNLVVSQAFAQPSDGWRDEVSFTLEPKDTYELKLTMNKDDQAQYRMVVDGGRVNFDVHAHGDGDSVTYEKGRGSKGSEGDLVAAFDGNHGWFWRNRDKKAINITLQLKGTYSALKHGK